MALYLGDSEKLNINLNNILYQLSIFSDPPITNGVLLSTPTNSILKELNGLYLTAKEEN